MIKLELKIADRLSNDYSPLYPKGTRVIYDQIKSDHDCVGGVAVRIVDPFKRPTWLSASWLQSFHRVKNENRITDAELSYIRQFVPEAEKRIAEPMSASRIIKLKVKNISEEEGR